MSEQFNEKLMNDYEALNEEIKIIQRENQTLIKQNTHFNSKYDDMENTIQKL